MRRPLPPMRLGAAEAGCSWDLVPARRIPITSHRRCIILGRIMGRQPIMLLRRSITRHRRFTTHRRGLTTPHPQSIIARVGEAGDHDADFLSFLRSREGAAAPFYDKGVERVAGQHGAPQDLQAEGQQVYSEGKEPPMFPNTYLETLVSHGKAREMTCGASLTVSKPLSLRNSRSCI